MVYLGEHEDRITVRVRKYSIIENVFYEIMLSQIAHVYLVGQMVSSQLDRPQCPYCSNNMGVKCTSTVLEGGDALMGATGSVTQENNLHFRKPKRNVSFQINSAYQF